jgi:hypothetical protein
LHELQKRWAKLLGLRVLILRLTCSLEWNGKYFGGVGVAKWNGNWLVRETIG